MLLTLLLLAAAPVPSSNPGRWVTLADYPPEALAARAQGSVIFTLNVGNDGMPKGCSIVESSGSASLDNATCQLLMVRARFQPVGADGYSAKSTYTNSVRWALPTN